MSSLIQLYSGAYFDPLNPDPALIDLESIAQSLSLQCRYGGHCKFHYSVAQHSVLVCDKLRQLYPDRPDLHVWGLLHDADEGLGLPDMPRHVKYAPEMAAYREAQRRLLLVVAKRFGLGIEAVEVTRFRDGGFRQFRMPEQIEPPAVKEVDNRMLATEWPVLKRPGWISDDSAEPYDDVYVQPWEPGYAKAEFLNTADKLGIQ